MKIGVSLNPTFGKAFKRIDKAFHDYAPKEIIWTDLISSDFNIVHVVGGAEAHIIDSKSIIIQHCYYTTYGVDWSTYWTRVPLTISFHNLTDYTDKKFNFYRTPWGADDRLFRKIPGISRNKKVFVTGHVAATECIDRLYNAARRVDKKIYHTGQNFSKGGILWRPENYQYLEYMDDNAYVNLLNSVEYVAGMRLIEGFEMACIEGLFCGATPIVLDLPTYDFYKGFGIFVNPYENIEDQLTGILATTPPPISDETLNLAREKFSWANIIPRIFNKILEL